MLSSKKIVEDYTKRKDWRVLENSSAPYSHGAMNKYILGEVSKDYWLREVYDREIVEAYREGYVHLHDLGGLTIYCVGYSLRSILLKGVRGINNIPRSKPAKHFGAVLNQLTNLATLFQNEIMGAVAFSSVDTLLAPFIKEDNLSYEEVLQHMQNFIFSLNSNSRMGAEPAFTNVTLDLTPPKDLLNQKVIIGGEEKDYTYKDCQEAMNMFNAAFCAVMLEGDADGVPFAYPIPTYNIHERFDWDNPANDPLWELAGTYGAPYFANFLNSDMNPEDARSMCCRLRLDKRELLRRTGGLFGSGDSTGSIGVVTINLPRLGYLASGDKDEFFYLLEKYMDVAKNSLEIKRSYLIEEVIEKKSLPAFMEYVGGLDNFFSTIGYVGGNELCENLLGVSIKDPVGQKFMIEVLEFMRDRLKDYQVMTGNLYNLEATPAESTCYRLAALDVKMLPGIKTQGTEDAPYYTNSCHLPVSEVESIYETTLHQNDLQKLHTGGTVIHYYIDGPISGAMAKRIVKSICTKFEVPYISISPVNCFCPEHNMLPKYVDKCPICGKETEAYQRITGYRRNVKNFNVGKAAEFRDRNQYSMTRGSFDNL